VITTEVFRFLRSSSSKAELTEGGFGEGEQGQKILYRERDIALGL